MTTVVDTNILFSALLSSKSVISDLLLNSFSSFNFIAPVYLQAEIERHEDKLLKIASYSKEKLSILKQEFFKQIQFYELEEISTENWQTASTLCQSVDAFDAPFVALA